MLRKLALLGVFCLIAVPAYAPPEDEWISGLASQNPLARLAAARSIANAAGNPHRARFLDALFAHAVVDPQDFQRNPETREQFAAWITANRQMIKALAVHGGDDPRFLRFCLDVQREGYETEAIDGLNRFAEAHPDQVAGLMARASWKERLVLTRALVAQGPAATHAPALRLVTESIPRAPIADWSLIEVGTVQDILKALPKDTGADFVGAAVDLLRRLVDHAPQVGSDAAHATLAGVDEGDRPMSPFLYEDMLVELAGALAMRVPKDAKLLRIARDLLSLLRERGGEFTSLSAEPLTRILAGLARGQVPRPPDLAMQQRQTLETLLVAWERHHYEHLTGLGVFVATLGETDVETRDEFFARALRSENPAFLRKLVREIQDHGNVQLLAKVRGSPLCRIYLLGN